LASPRTPLPPPASVVQQQGLPPERLPRPCGVFQAVPGTLETLHALVPQVLRQLLRVTRYISRARLNLPLRPYQQLTAAELDATPGADISLFRPIQAQPSPLIDMAPVMWDACELDTGLADLPKLIWERDRHGAVTRSVPKSGELPGESKSRNANSQERCSPPNIARSDQLQHDVASQQRLRSSPQAQQDQARQRSLADPPRARQDQATHRLLADPPREIPLQQLEEGVLQFSEAQAAPKSEQNMSAFHEAEAALEGLSAQLSRVRQAHTLA